MLRAMKQRALSAAVADSVTNSARDSPTISLSGKARAPCPPASCSLGHTGLEVAFKVSSSW